MADLKHLSETLLQLTVREALQLGALLLTGAGITSGEVDSNDVVLIGHGNAKIQVIKVLREITTLGLKEAKDLSEMTPSVVLRNVSKLEAEAARLKLVEVGGTVEIRPS